MDEQERQQRGEQARRLHGRLAAAGVQAVRFTYVDTSGIARVKGVPTARLETAATDGVGMSPVFDAFLPAPAGSRLVAVGATAGCWAVLALRLGADPALPAYLYLAVLGVTLARIDVSRQRLPDVLTLPAYPITAGLLAVAELADSRSGNLLRALLGGIALLAVYGGIRLVQPLGMGLGDVKLAGVLGMAAAWLGWDTWTLALLAPFLLGTAGSLLLLARRRAGLRTQLPFGPYMLAGTLLAVLVG